MAKEKKQYSEAEIKERRRFVGRTMLLWLWVALVIICVVALIQVYVIQPSV